MQFNPLLTDSKIDTNLLYSKNNKGVLARVDTLELTVQNLSERITDLSTTIDNLKYILDGNER